MTKTTPEKSKARENNGSGEEEGSLTETEMRGGIHAALPALGMRSDQTIAKADEAFGSRAAQLCGLIR